MEKSKYSLSQKFIIYFDILGYKDFFEDKENDIIHFLNDNLSLFEDTKNVLKEDRWGFIISYKTFSDNCIISIESNELSEIEIFIKIIRMVADLQLKFLRDYKIAIRGAITKGSIYIDDKLVFGSGLINAVKLENNEAQYPRIIIDKDNVNIDLEKHYDLVSVDSDGKYYVSYFSLLKVKKSVYKPEPDEKKEICKVRDALFFLLNKYGHYDNRYSDPKKIEESRKKILKYLWMLIKYNEIVDTRHLPVHINYEITVNTRIMRFEIQNIKKGSWPIIVN